MFTGLIEALGTITRFQRSPQGAQVGIRIPPDWTVRVGESVAVNGVCLTISQIQSSEVGADLSPETLSRSHPSLWQVGTPVNLERALKMGEPMGGHWVQGHVDGIGVLTAITGGEHRRYTFSFPESLKRYLVEKGSVAIQGISLTIAHLEGTSLSVAVIPLTWRKTTLGLYRPGQKVHIEVDIVAKYVERLIKR